MGAFLTQNVVDVFRVLRTALRVAILCEVNCHTSFERTSHNGLKTLTLILLKALMRINEELDCQKKGSSDTIAGEQCLRRREL